MEKRAGVLLPLFSVPGNQGIGDLGQKTLMMIDEIADAGYGIWSMLPLSPNENNCPYQAVSSMAGDPIYINIDRLAEMGLLTQSSIVNCNKFKDFVDYDTVRTFKEPYFQRAFKAFRKNYSRFKPDFEQFKKEAFWLNSFTAYEVFRQNYDGAGWTSWDDEYKHWPEKQEITLRDYVEKIFYIQFLQFIFYKQLQDVVDYAHKRGLKLMTDMPFFLQTDSADVWANKRDFMVDMDGHVEEYAGTPPDAYYADGQRWNSPVFNLENMSANEYKLIRDRFRWNARYYDLVRVLHFKAFDTYWRVPDNKDAAKGRWGLGPGSKLLNYLQQDNPNLEIVAEDMGLIRPVVRELEEEFKIPSMEVLQYKMETKVLKKPLPVQSVVYTSTQDTPTMEEDYATYTNNKRIALRRFFKKRGYEHRAFHDLVCHFALDSDAETTILNVADIMGMKGQGRLNHVDVDDNNDWTWKIKDYKVLPGELKKTTDWLHTSGRCTFDKAPEAA